MTSMQGIRDMNFPFKFDLATNCIRTKVASGGLLNNARGIGFEPVTAEEQAGMRVSHYVLFIRNNQQLFDANYTERP